MKTLVEPDVVCILLEEDFLSRTEWYETGSGEVTKRSNYLKKLGLRTSASAYGWWSINGIKVTPLSVFPKKVCDVSTIPKPKQILNEGRSWDFIDGD